MISKIIGLCSAFIMSTSCVRIAVIQEPVSVPVIFQPMFHSCEESDGEAVLRLNDAQSVGLTSTIVWNFKSQRNANIQVNSQLGDTLMEINRSGHVWKVIGPRAIKINEDSTGIIDIEGYELPLRSHELACVMAGYWPAQWLSTLKIAEQGGSFLRLTGKDELRKIDVTISMRKSGEGFRSGDIKSCVVLKWGGIFGLFEHEGSVCRDQARGGVVMRLDGIGNYKVEWTISDES